MAIIRWEPINNMMDDFFGEDDVFMPMRRMARFTPAIDVYEDKDNVVVESAISGIDPEKISITVENDMLKIEGKSEQKSEVDEKNYYRKEIRAGQFVRTVALPKKVDSDKAQADYVGGILKITLPKSEEVKPRSVKVNIKK